MKQKNLQQTNKPRPLSILAIGGSIFVMFFGAGNIVFPLALGYQFHDHPWLACMGMLLTAVLVPLAGLVAMLLYAGDYQVFFRSIGKIPGYFFIVIILCLIGPFGGIPRAIAVSHSTIASLFPEKVSHSFLLSLPIFSLISCGLIYIFACRLSKLLQWLGSVFFPVMMATLVWIIFKALSMPSHLSTVSVHGARSAWLSGVIEGFNTMDLLAGFFFCSIVLASIQQQLAQDKKHTDEEVPLDFQKINKSSRIRLTLSFVLAAILLSAIYLGFTLCSARHASILHGVPKGEILGRISFITLGPNSILTGISVFIACLTTEIALVSIFADFLARTYSAFAKNSKIKMTYPVAVLLTLLPTYFMAVLNFENISSLLVPLLQISYPALIMLTFGNIAHKLWKFRYAPHLFYVTLSLTIFTFVLWF